MMDRRYNSNVYADSDSAYMTLVSQTSTRHKFGDLLGSDNALRRHLAGRQLRRPGAGSAQRHDRPLDIRPNRQGRLQAAGRDGNRTMR